MIELKDNKFIPRHLLRSMTMDQWTMESLATTQVRRLIQYRGIGPNIANKIIDEARRLTNATKLAEAAVLDPPPPTPTLGDGKPSMSTRVKRIKESSS